MTTMGTRQPLLLLVTLTLLIVSVTHGAPSGSVDESSGGESEDLPEYRLHPRPPLYRYQSKSRPSRDFLNSVYASPAQDIILDNPQPKVSVQEISKTLSLPSTSYSQEEGFPQTPPPFAPELTEDFTRVQESGGLGPFSLLDQLRPSLW